MLRVNAKTIPSYNMVDGLEASYVVSEGGNTTVTVQCRKHLKIREIHVGVATLEFYWNKSWVFVPTIMNPTPAEHTETMTEDGEIQLVNVALGNKIFPASGLVDRNVRGEINVPAVHFDVPYGVDLWVFLFRSPWFQLKIDLEKSQLEINHGLAKATAEISSDKAYENSGQSLRADVSLFGEGFKWVKLSVKRRAGRASDEEDLGSLTNGSETFTWNPKIRNFDVLLVTHSQMHVDQFVHFLRLLGAETQEGAFFGPSLADNFVLCDGPNMNYQLVLTGEKGLLGHEKDETQIKLNHLG